MIAFCVSCLMFALRHNIFNLATRFRSKENIYLLAYLVIPFTCIFPQDAIANATRNCSLLHRFTKHIFFFILFRTLPPIVNVSQISCSVSSSWRFRGDFAWENFAADIFIYVHCCKWACLKTQWASLNFASWWNWKTDLVDLAKTGYREEAMGSEAIAWYRAQCSLNKFVVELQCSLKKCIVKPHCLLNRYVVVPHCVIVPMDIKCIRILAGGVIDIMDIKCIRMLAGGVKDTMGMKVYP